MFHWTSTLIVLSDLDSPALLLSTTLQQISLFLSNMNGTDKGRYRMRHKILDFLIFCLWNWIFQSIFTQFWLSFLKLNYRQVTRISQICNKLIINRFRQYVMWSEDTTNANSPNLSLLHKSSFTESAPFWPKLDYG